MAQRFLLDQELANHSQATVKWYRQKLRQLCDKFGGDTPLNQLDREQLLSWIAEFHQAGRTPNYIRGWYQVLQTLATWARREGYPIHPSLVTEGDRWFALRKPKATETEVVTFSDEQLRDIEEAAAQTHDHFTAQRNRLLVRLLAGTGLRLQEALDLTLEDWQEDRLRVRVGKGRRFRWVPLSSRLQKAIGRYVDLIRPTVPDEHLFISQTGTPLARDTAAHLFQRVSKATGLRVHAHAFRHTYATEYLRRGGEIERLRRILGHTSYSMVSRYLHLVGPDLNRGIDELAPR